MKTREAPAGDVPSIDPVNQCLWRGGSSVELTPRAFEVLRFLAERPQRLVTKRELLDGVWGEEAAVTDGVLKVCVAEIRKALGDDPRSPRFIETAHRRGYRFLLELARREGPETTARAAPPAAAPTLVGRDAVLARLRALVENAADGEREIVFVSGPPGIGKTSVVDACLREAAAARPLWVARGQCLEQYGAGEGYLPVLEAIGGLARGADRTRIVQWLARTAPTWIAPLGAAAGDADRARLEREVLGATQERMLREMAEALEALSAERPVVLLLEDLHWSDLSTLDLVALLARRRGPARLMVVATYRPSDVLRAGHPLKPMKQELAMHRLCEDVELDCLPEAAIADYLAARFAGSAFPASLARALHRRTEGNPLFLVNVVDDLLASGAIAESGGRAALMGDVDSIANHLPESVRQAIELQVDRLTPEEQQALAAASVAGVEFPSAAVAAALDQEMPAVEEVLDRLVAREHFLSSAGVRELPNRTVSARYAFRHTLYASMLYERIAPARRMRLHLQIAERGEQIYGRRSNEIGAELAAHFEAAGDARRAVHYLRQAAEKDARRSANREAHAQLAHALELVEKLEAPARRALELPVLEELGLLRRSMGDMQGSVEAFRALVERAREHGETERLVKALLYLGSTLFWIDRERCLDAIDLAVEESAGVRDACLRAHARGYQGHWNLNLRGFSRESVAACADAIEAARAARDVKLLSLHVVRFAYAQCLEGKYAASLQTSQEGLELALAAGDAFDFLLCQFFRAWAQLHAGRLADMQATLEDAIAMAEKNGHGEWAMLFRLETAQRWNEAGEHARAKELCLSALAHARKHPEASGQIFFHGHIVLAAAELGLRRPKEAAKRLAEVDRRLRSKDGWMDWLLYLPFHATRAEALLALGDPEAAREEAERLRERAAASDEPTYLALAHRALAEAAMGLKDLAGAERALDAALAIVNSREAPLAAWRVHASAERLHRLRKRESAAKAAGRLAEKLRSALVAPPRGPRQRTVQ